MGGQYGVGLRAPAKMVRGPLPLWVVGASLLAGALNGFVLGMRYNDEASLKAYKGQEVILGPPQNPDCTHHTTVGTMVEALINPGYYGSDTWFHEHLRWMYLCGAFQDDKKRRGVADACKDKDRCT